LADRQCRAAPSSSRLRAARDLRAGLRASAGGNAGLAVDATELETGSAALARARLQAVLSRQGEPTIVVAGDEFDAVLGDIAVAFVTAALTGRWVRVKACANEECRFVFWDDSRNASRRWCDMQRCGSRQKMRTYRTRHRPR
jgi:predicted RNA-binding Zn ribbon-like protein